ncbi:MAG TPA: ATP-binding protein [Terriglobales bacterium]|nr:ATP-binding protein [Terriglobales bacterium]
MLILMAGLPGTGKSTLARQIAERLHATILSKDTIRHTIFPPELIEYSTQQDDFVMDLLLRTAEYIWHRDPQQIIILDGRTFSRALQRQHVITFADSHRQPWRIVECVCDDSTAKSRLSQPEADHPAGNRTPGLYDKVKSHWEPITEPHITIRTDQPIDIEAIIRQLVL